MTDSERARKLLQTPGPHDGLLGGDMSVQIKLNDAYKRYTKDQDKILPPEETVQRLKAKFDSLNLDILEQAVRNENKEKDLQGPDTKKVSAEEFIESRGQNYLQLNAIKGGFSLTKKSKSRRVPRYITIWMAYEVRTGNPFKKYTPLDFDVSLPPLNIQVSGAKLLLNKHNAIQIEVQQGDFKLAITGFDMHRDLRIKTNP